MRRFAEVDSEILFRLAANAARDGAMDIGRFKARLRRCRGQITAVIACRTDPQTVIVLKGNRPLELRWHPRRKAVLYASDPAYLDAVLAEDAVVRGRLFETSSGIPVLQVPEEDILAVGTTTPLADVATQAHVTARMSNPEPTPDRLSKKGTGVPWGPVYGELLAFDAPETRLPAIDRLEGFRPGGPCLYRRVLIPVRINRNVLPAWLFVGEDPISKRFAPLGEPCWPR